MNNLEPLFVRPERAASLLGVGRTKLFALLASGELASVRHGRTRLVPVESLRDFARDLSSTTATDRQEGSQRDVA